VVDLTNPDRQGLRTPRRSTRARHGRATAQSRIFGERIPVDDVEYLTLGPERMHKLYPATCTNRHLRGCSQAAGDGEAACSLARSATPGIAAASVHWGGD